MLNDQVVSFIRTAVPGAVAALLAFLADTFGVVGIDSEAAVAAAVTATLAVYYAAARAAEARWPQAGWLLGAPRQPHYSDDGSEAQ